MKSAIAIAAVVAMAIGASAETAAAQSPWRPRAGLTWQWQLTGRVDVTVRASVFDIDLLTQPQSVVSELKRRGRRVICYFSAGTNESFRAPAQQFPAQVRGGPLADFPDERWLDVRRIDLIGPLIESRLDLCRARGYDGVEFDNVDAYANRSGFPLTAADQLRFNRYLAAEAHERGLAAGLKNDIDQVTALAASFEFAVNEQCFQYDECGVLHRDFIRRRKPVFHAEYALAPARFCTRARGLGFSSLYKRERLDAFRVVC